MHVMKNRGGGRSLRSTLNKVLSVVACSALLATGAIIVAASPAGASTAASQVGFTPQPSSTATVNGAPVTFSVTIEGTDGNVANSNLTDTITITSGCTFTGTNPKPAASGVASFSLVFTQTGTCNFVAADTTTTLATPTTTSTSVTVYSGAATKLGFSVEPASTVTAGSTLAFTVQAQNAAGALASTGGQTDAISISSSCTIAGTTTGLLVGGSLSFTAVIIDGGISPCTLTASDATEALTAAVSTGITVTASTATKLLFTTQPPATVVAAAVLAPFRVSVTDPYGNVETYGTNSTDTITITPSSGCTIGGTTAVAAITGAGTFSALTITSDGSCTLTATDTSHVLTTAASTAVDSQGAQAALVVSSITGYLGSPLTLTTSGGTGTGAVTFAATVGTAAGCVVTGSVLTVTSLGTCIVTATKAASTTNLAATSVATTVTFVVPGPQPKRVIGFVTAGVTKTISIAGMYFYGRPKITSHGGTTAIVTKDTGTLLTVRVTVKAGSRNGTFTFTIRLANGKTGTVRYVQRP